MATSTPLPCDSGQIKVEGLGLFHTMNLVAAITMTAELFVLLHFTEIKQTNRASWHLSGKHLLHYRKRWAIRKQIVRHTRVELFMTLTTREPAVLIVSHTKSIYRLLHCNVKGQRRYQVYQVEMKQKLVLRVFYDVNQKSRFQVKFKSPEWHWNWNIIINDTIKNSVIFWMLCS